MRRTASLTYSIGIGLAIVKKLLSENANVVVQARNEEALKKLQDENPDAIRTFAGDMGDLSLPQQVVDLALKEFGHLDAVIVNHGTMNEVAKIEDSDLHEWRKLFDVNFFSAVAFVGTKGRKDVPSLTAHRQRLRCQPYGSATAASYSPPPVYRRELTAAGAHMELPKQQ